MKCVKSVFLTKKDFRGNKLETFYLLSFVIFDDFCFCFNASCCGRRSENKNLLNHRTVKTRKLWNRKTSFRLKFKLKSQININDQIICN